MTARLQERPFGYQGPNLVPPGREDVLEGVAAPPGPSDLPVSQPTVEGLAGLDEQMHRLNVLATYCGLQRVRSTR